MKFAIAADHGGFELKNILVEWMKSEKYDIKDLGNHEFDMDDDYPDFAVILAKEIASGKVERGILICGSGVGASITANKIKGIRACVCHDAYSAHQGVEHDDMNIICFGARIIGVELAKDLIRNFAGAEFINNGRFKRRLEKLLNIEK